MTRPSVRSVPRRVVVKVGTNVLARDGRPDAEWLASLAEQIAELRRDGADVAVVTSGAIGLGRLEMGIPGRITDVEMRQACAAIGQPILMQQYRAIFSAAGMTVGQLLITREALENRKSYVRLRNAVERLLELGVVPVFNENDGVSVAEIGSAFGDNDQLSALVASKLDAELLILLSDVDGYCTGDPRRDASATRIPFVAAVTDEMIAAAGQSGSALGTGGMVTKLRAVRIASEGGCRVVLAHGRSPDILRRIIAGDEVGTTFAPRRSLPNRQRWILHSTPRGRLTVDEGAMTAIESNRSLLATGIVAVEGEFNAGDVIVVNGRVKLVTAFASHELAALVGRPSSEIARVAGDRRRIIARPERMVTIDDDVGERA